MTVVLVTEFVLRCARQDANRSTDRAGLAMNGLLVPFLLSTIRLLGSGPTNANDIAVVMNLAAITPWASCPADLATLPRT